MCLTKKYSTVSERIEIRLSVLLLYIENTVHRVSAGGVVHILRFGMRFQDLDIIIQSSMSHHRGSECNI